MFRFAHPYMLYLLLLIPVVIGGYLYFSHKRGRAIREFGDEELMKELMPLYSTKRYGLKNWLLIIAVTLQVIVMAGPQFGAKYETTKRSGIEIMVAVDVSNSMNAMDIQPSRLDVAKMAVSKLVDNLENDRLGVVIFAGQAYIQLPITSDYPSAKMFLNSITTGSVPVQGTDIGAAIDKCLASFSGQQDINRSIIIITDGEDNEGKGVEAAKRALSEGVRVFTVGMGTAKGSPIPVRPYQTSEFLKDMDGNVVISKIDEQSLINVATQGGGAYVSGVNLRQGINALVNELSNIEKSEFEAKIYTAYNDRFQYIEVIVVILLLIDLLILGRKNKKLDKFNIFK